MISDSLYQPGFLSLERYVNTLVIWTGYRFLSVTILLNRGINNNIWLILSILVKSICKNQSLNYSHQNFDMKNQDSAIETCT